MITCTNHGEQTEYIIGDKNYCPVCVQYVLDKRINNYEVNE